MDLIYKKSRSGIDRDYIFKRNRLVSIEGRGDLLIKNTQVHELYFCNTLSQKPQQSTSNTDSQIIAAKMQVDNLQQTIEEEINKLQNFRHIYLEDLSKKITRQQQAIEEENDNHPTWAQHLSKNNDSIPTDESRAPSPNQTRPPDPTKCQKLSQNDVPTSIEKSQKLSKNHGSMPYRECPVLSPNQQQTAARSLFGKRGLITTQESPVSSPNQSRPLDNQSRSKKDVPISIEKSQKLSKNHAPISVNEYPVLSPNQQQRAARSLSRKRGLITTQESPVSSPNQSRPLDNQELSKKDVPISIEKSKNISKNHAPMSFSECPVLSPNQQQTTTRSLSRKRGLITTQESPVSSANQSRPLDNQELSKKNVPISIEKFPKLAKKHAPMSYSECPVLSPDQQQRTDRSLSRKHALINIKDSLVLGPSSTRPLGQILSRRDALIITDNPPRQSSKEDVISINNSRQSEPSKSLSSQTSEELNYSSTNIVKTSYSSYSDGDKLPDTNNVSQEKPYQHEEERAESRRITGGCNCNNIYQQQCSPRQAALLYCQHCYPDVINYNVMPASISEPCSPYPRYQQQPSCSRRTTDLNTEEMCRGLSVKPLPNRINVKNTAASENRQSQKSKPRTPTRDQKSQNQDTAKYVSVPKQEAEKSDNAQWVKIKREKQIVPGKKHIANDKRLHLDYMRKYKEEQEKTAGKSSSKTTSDLEENPTYTRLPVKKAPLQKTVTVVLHQNVALKPDGSVQKPQLPKAISTHDVPQNKSQEKEVDNSNIQQAYNIKDIQNNVSESLPNYQTNKVNELPHKKDKTDGVKHPEREHSKMAPLRPESPHKPIMFVENKDKELRLGLPAENDIKKEEKPLLRDHSKTAQLSEISSYKLITPGENSALQITQQQVTIKAKSNPKKEPAMIDSQAPPEKVTDEEKLPQQVPTQQRSIDSQEIAKVKMTHIPRLSTAQNKNHDFCAKRYIQELSEKLRFDQSTKLRQGGAVKQASIQHNSIQTKPAELSLQESNCYRNKQYSCDASTKMDHQRALRLLNEEHIPNTSHYQQMDKLNVKATSPSKSNYESFYRNRNRNEIKPCQYPALTNNTQTVSKGQSLDRFEEPVLNDSSDFSSQHCREAERKKHYHTKLQSTQKEYESIIPSNNNTLMPRQADIPVSLLDRKENGAADLEIYDSCQNNDLNMSIEDSIKQQSICKPECKERNYQSHLATRTPKAPSNSTDFQRSKRLVNLKDERGHGKRINTVECNRGNIDWERANEQIKVRKADYAYEENDGYNDENTLNMSWVSSSAADVTCNESLCEDDYATCNESNFGDDYDTCSESQTECEDNNEFPSFSGCPCMYDEFLQFASLYVPIDEAKKLKK